MRCGGRVSVYVLDSDCVIDCLGGVPLATQLILQLFAQDEVVCTTAVVVAEVVTGLLPADRAYAREFLSALVYLPTDHDAAEQAGAWRYAYARRGIALATADLLIAATAHAHGAAVVTGNLRHFPMPEVQVLPLPRP